MCKWSVQKTTQKLLRGFFYSLNANVKFKSSKQEQQLCMYITSILLYYSQTPLIQTQSGLSKNSVLMGCSVNKVKKSPFTKSSNARKHYKNRSSLYYLIKTDLCITSLMPQSSTGVYKSLYSEYCTAGNNNMLSTRDFFFLQEGKVCKNMPLIMNCLHQRG